MITLSLSLFPSHKLSARRFIREETWSKFLEHVTEVKEGPFPSIPVYISDHSTRNSRRMMLLRFVNFPLELGEQLRRGEEEIDVVGEDLEKTTKILLLGV